MLPRLILGGKFWSETQKSRIFAVDMQIMEQLQVDFKQIHAEASASRQARFAVF